MDMSRHKSFKIVTIDAETEKAWLLALEIGVTEWFPKSQCRVVGFTLYVPEWLAERNGLNEKKTS